MFTCGCPVQAGTGFDPGFPCCCSMICPDKMLWYRFEGTSYQCLPQENCKSSPAVSLHDVPRRQGSPHSGQNLGRMPGRRVPAALLSHLVMSETFCRFLLHSAQNLLLIAPQVQVSSRLLYGLPHSGRIFQRRRTASCPRRLAPPVGAGTPDSRQVRQVERAACCLLARWPHLNRSRKHAVHLPWPCPCPHKAPWRTGAERRASPPSSRSRLIYAAARWVHVLLYRKPRFFQLVPHWPHHAGNAEETSPAQILPLLESC